MIIEGLINNKKLKNKGKDVCFPSGGGQPPAPHWLDSLDCQGRVTLIILKAAEDCCGNEDKQRRADR